MKPYGIEQGRMSADGVVVTLSWTETKDGDWKTPDAGGFICVKQSHTSSYPFVLYYAPQDGRVSPILATGSLEGCMEEAKNLVWTGIQAGDRSPTKPYALL